MKVPAFNKEQPGCSYYYSPVGMYTCGVVNKGHLNNDGTVGEHMHAHVYHEGTENKCSNNVASLIMKTLRIMDIIRDTEVGGELNIFFDNCSSQNKNSTVLKLMVWHGEMGYFKCVNFNFLIVGHTKNAADHLFNALKFQYRKENIFTMEDLLSILNVSPLVTVHEASADDFFDYDKLFSLYYVDFQSKIKQNHIFASANEMSGNQLLVRLCESNLEEHPVTTHTVIKKGFYGCKNYATLMEAVNNRQKDTKAST